MGKKKNMKYEKKEESLSMEELEEMLVKEPGSVNYKRVNVTMEEPLLEKIDKLRPNETRSGYFRRLVKKDLKRIEREKKIERWAKQAKDANEETEKFMKELDPEVYNEVLEEYEN